jgi:hypothetical protein
MLPFNEVARCFLLPTCIDKSPPQSSHASSGSRLEAANPTHKSLPLGKVFDNSELTYGVLVVRTPYPEQRQLCFLLFSSEVNTHRFCKATRLPLFISDFGKNGFGNFQNRMLVQIHKSLPSPAPECDPHVSGGTPYGVVETQNSPNCHVPSQAQSLWKTKTYVLPCRHPTAKMK